MPAISAHGLVNIPFGSRFLTGFSAEASGRCGRSSNYIYPVFSTLQFPGLISLHPVCYFLVVKSRNFSSDDGLPEQPADNLIAAIDAAIKSITKMLTARAENDEELDWSLSDLLKLLQVRREIVGEQPKEVYAYWVDDPKDRIAALRAKEQEEEQQGPRRVA
jgi:hypothetical protein